MKVFYCAVKLINLLVSVGCKSTGCRDNQIDTSTIKVESGTTVEEGSIATTDKQHICDRIA